MANSVDSRVVQMQFDNAQFEQGVQQTMSSLEKLNKSTEQLQGAEKGVGRLKSALGNFSIGAGIQNGINAIGTGLSSVATTGINAFNSIAHAATTGLKAAALSVTAIGAAITGIAVSGGINRAMNIEQAKFQLKGLGIAWSDIEGDISHAVKGTAYGLDSAAKAASQFAASGVEVGDSMKAALRGISGVAAMTSSDYDSIANVFTAVAGQGKVMTQQLRMLELRGMNAAASMAKYFTEVNNGSRETTESVKASIAEITGGAEVTEETIRELVTQGKINFDVFSHAMDDTFGLHAKKANETFTGAMSNVKAALSRIGANFATSGMEALRQVFVKLIPAIDGVNSALKPLNNIFEKSVMGMSQKAQGLIESLIQIREETDEWGNVSYKFVAFNGPLADALDIFSHLLSLPKENQAAEWYNYSGAFKNIADILGDLATSASSAFKAIFPQSDSFYSNFINGMKNAAESFEEFTEKLKFSHDTNAAYQTIFSIFKNFFQGIENISSAASTIGPLFTTLVYTFQKAFPNAVEDSLGVINSITEGFANFTEKLKPSPGALKTVIQAFQVLLNVAKLVGAVFQNIIMPIGEVLGSMFMDIAAGVGKGISKIVEFLFQLTGGSGGPNMESFLETLNGVRDGILEFKDAFAGLTTFDNIVEGIASSLSGFADGLKRFGQAIRDNVRVFQPFFDKIKEFFSIVVEPMKTLTWSDIFAGLGTAGFVTFLAGFDKIFKALAKTLGDFKKYLRGGEENGSGSIFDFNRILGLDGINEILWQTGRALDGFTVNVQAGALVKVAGAIAILALSLMALSTLNWDQLSRGSAGILALGGGLAAFMQVLSAMDSAAFNDVGAIKLGVMLLLIATSMGVLASAVKKLAELQPDELLKGIVGVGITLGILVKYAEILSQSATKSMAGAMALGSMAQALLLLMIPVVVFGKMDTNALIQGAVGVGAILAMLTAMAHALSNMKGLADIVLIAPALVSVALAIDLLTIAVVAMGNMDGSSLVQGLLGLGVALTILASGCYAMKGAEAGAVALQLVAAAMIPLSAGLLVLSLIPMEALFGALLGLAAALAIFAVAAKALGPSVPAMAALAAVLLTLGGATAAIGAGVSLLALGLLVLGANAGVAAVGLTVLLTALAEGLLSFVSALLEGIVNAIASLIQTIIDNAGNIATAIVTLLSALITAATTLVPQIVQLGVTIILSLVQGILTIAPVLIQAGIALIVMLLQGLAAGIGTIIQAGFELAIAFINGLADAVGNESNQQALTDAIGNLIEAMLSAAGNFITQGLPDLGGRFLNGLHDAIFGAEGDAEAAGEAVGQATTSGLESGLSEAPGKAEDAASTAIANFDALAGDLEASAANAGEAATSGLDSTLTGMESNTDSVLQTLNSTMGDQGSVFGSTMTDVGEEASDGLDSGMSTMEDNAASRTSAAISTVSGKGSDANTAGSSVGSQMGSGMYSGLDSWITPISNKAAEAVRSAKSAAEQEAKIKSPSRVFARIGMYMDLGLVKGMEDYKNRVAQAGKDVSRVAINSAMLGTAYLVDALDGIDYNPTIRPVFDDSLVRAGVSGMNRYLGSSAGLSADYIGTRQGAGYLGSDSSSTKSTVINISLDYNAGEDGSAIVNDIAMALKTRNILEA